MATSAQLGTERDELEPRSTPSLTSLVTGIVNDAQELARQQFELFRHELRDELRKTKEAVVCSAVGGGALALGAICLCLGLVHLLFWALPAVPLWVWHAVVGALLAGCGVALLYAAKQKLDPLPDQAVAELRENIRWITNPRK
jgi:hypothetical protein